MSSMASSMTWRPPLSRRPANRRHAMNPNTTIESNVSM